MKTKNKLPRFAFFGTPELAVTVLNELEAAGLVPALIITREDKPAGRKLVMTPPPTKVWAAARGIPVLQPHSLKNQDIVDEIKTHAAVDSGSFDFFIVVAYGRIIPQAILDIPTFGSINLHPSLLPKLRGPSPIETSILTLDQDEIGVSIMLLDAEMDHGPILVQEGLAEEPAEWPAYADVLEDVLARRGGALLARLLPQYFLDATEGRLMSQEQDHSQATFCQKITKEDGLLNLDDDAETNVRKVRAYCVWPRAHFFVENKRVIVTRARVENQVFIIEKVIPEGKKEMCYEDFLKSTRQI